MGGLGILAEIIPEHGRVIVTAKVGGGVTLLCVERGSAGIWQGLEGRRQGYCWQQSPSCLEYVIDKENDKLYGTGTYLQMS